ncbi:D-2-hydroxyacid dehydrogenase [Catenovulum sp. SM1970]|uniref:D-2-hydroxyacid dehydrogenase n=1 Tax=Marinifaba aquimaris TaxID=2741323 RepID=UPI001573CED5|nr:D-2-hydroxyacid dehydrogenase [Marinifaba aquimaris]NTS78784.1 D-2-hydroxyacid dehydrogenase [Marinifaba aquimaris]
MTKIIFLDADTISDADLSAIEQQGELTCYNSDNQDAISADEFASADVLISNKILLKQSEIARAKALKLICVAATGYNNVDLNVAEQNQVAVTNVAGYSTESVAQHVFALLLNWSIKLTQYQTDVNAGKWQDSPMFCLLDHPTFELTGKTIGIIGYGDIGRATARLAEAFGMKVIIAERANATNIRAGRTSLDDVIEQSDVISLHCPLSAQTDQLVDAAFLAKMKSDAILINTARGGLIDEAALAKALDAGQLQAALLDGLSVEPPPSDHPLLPQRPNLILTPHTAWASKQARQKLVDEIAANIAAFKAGEKRNRLV